MLEKIQEGGHSLVIKIILGLIIISFALAGIGSYLGGGRTSSVADVNGEPISKVEFDQAYQNQRQQLRQRMGDAYARIAGNAQYMKQVKQSVVQQLIAQKLLDQQAKAMGIRIDDKQVENAIMGMKGFHKNGSFDNQTFLNWLSNNGLTADRFSHLIRKNMQDQQLQSALFGSQFALPHEVSRIAALENQQRSFRYVHLGIDKFRDAAAIKPKDVKAYYQTHQNQFRSPETVDIHYILLDMDALAKTIPYTDKQLKTYLENHADKYSRSEQRHFAHILLKFGNDPKHALAQANQVEQKLKDGASFKAMVKKYSQDIQTKSKEGVLNWVERGTLPKAFDQAGFALKNVGDVSSVVKTKYGYHIIQLEGIKPSKLPSVASIHSQLVKAYRKDQALTQFYDISNKLDNLSFQMPDNLQQVAKELNLKVTTAKNISRNNLPQQINSPAVVKQIFSKEAIDKKQNSSMLNLSDQKAVVVRVTGHKDAHVKAFKDVKKQAKESLIDKKAAEASMAYAKKMVKVAHDSQQFEQLVASKSLHIKQADAVGRDARNINPQVVSEAFKLHLDKKGQQDTTTVQTALGDNYVVQLESIKQPKLSSELLKNITQQMPNILANQDYRLLLDYLESKADISYHGL